MIPKKLSIVTFGVATVLVLSSIIALSGAEYRDSGSAVQVAAPPSTLTMQRGGSSPKASTDVSDGLGTLYAAASYKISTEGCNAGEVRIVRVLSKGPNPGLFNQSSDCATYRFMSETFGGVVKGTFSWRFGFPLTWPTMPALYVHSSYGQDAIVVGVDDPTLPSGRLGFNLGLSFSSDVVPLMDPNPYVFASLYFNMTEDDSRTELELATAIASMIASSNLTSPPLAVYSLPAA